MLDRYGLKGCGGPDGPAESLDFFARRMTCRPSCCWPSCGRRCGTTRRPSRPPPTADVAADAIYRPFFKAGIAVVLTLGAVWGAYLLLRIGLTGTFAAAGLHEVNAHGHAQIFGWVGLFVMGFAYQAFPRFKHTALAHPRLAYATLGLMLAGIVGRSVAEPLAAALPGCWSVAVAAAWLEVAAVVAVRVRRRRHLAAGGQAGWPSTTATSWRRSAGSSPRPSYEAVYLAATLRRTGPGDARRSGRHLAGAAARHADSRLRPADDPRRQPAVLPPLSTACRPRAAA